MTEQEMRDYLDGWFFSIDYERCRTVSTPVPLNWTPSHKRGDIPDDGQNPNAYRWSVDDDQRLLAMRRERRTYRDIGAEMGLAASTVLLRYEALQAANGFVSARRRNRRPVKYPMELEAKVVALRKDGKGFHEIAPLVGCEHRAAQTIWRRYKDRQAREGVKV